MRCAWLAAVVLGVMVSVPAVASAGHRDRGGFSFSVGVGYSDYGHRSYRSYGGYGSYGYGGGYYRTLPVRYGSSGYCGPSYSYSYYAPSYHRAPVYYSRPSYGYGYCAPPVYYSAPRYYYSGPRYYYPRSYGYTTYRYNYCR